ncbi:MAG: hypothetical protein H6732_07645 [Alphaproteobacteria bacterium]|nr:hypothetical protein [Alphaproteobacteria bacterium]
MSTRDDPADALDERVRTLLREDGPDAAIAHLRAAADDPDLGPAATSRLAWIHERMGEGDTALAVLRDGRARWPERVELALEEADLLARDDDEPGARRIVEEVVQAHPEHGRALAALAALVVDDDPGQGLGLAERALDLDPRLVRAHAVRIDAARLRGDTEAVDRAVDRAIQAVPDEPTLRLLRAGLRMERGARDDALQDLKVVWSLSPGHPGVRELALEVVRRRQPLYRAVLAWRRGMQRLGPVPVLALLAAYVGLQALAEEVLADRAPWVGPLVMVFVVLLATLTYVADAVADLAVDLDEAGSILLDAPRRARARAVGGLVLMAAVFGPVGAVADHPALLAWGMLAAVTAVPAYLALTARGPVQQGGLVLLALVGLSFLGSTTLYGVGDAEAATGIAMLATLTCVVSTWVLFLAARLLARRTT